jgi:transposase-like protein
MTDITGNPIYTDEAAARAYLERLRWPGGILCVHCGSYGDDIAPVQKTGKRTKPTAPGKRYRPAREGLYYCNACKGQFSVTVGTIMEDSHLPLHKWLLAFRLMCSSKKGISSHQLHRTLGVSYKTAWHLSHRIRVCMRSGFFAPPMGGSGKTTEADETFIGRQEGQKKARSGYHHKMAVLTLIDRATGEARSFHIDKADSQNIMPIVRENIAKESVVVTDEARYYTDLKRGYYHAKVHHADEQWVVGDYHTNTVEGYFSIFKRGMKGVYQHCSEKHLHRYLAEFDFRYSNRAKLGYDDASRTNKALAQIEGKRLTYRRVGKPRSEAGGEA